MDYVKPYLDYFSANPEWAIVIIFLIAFGEALLIIGLFVPSTVVLVGAGMLVGTGHLGFWPVFLATAIGAIAGDQISYWAGRLFGVHLKDLWPLNRYPALVARGEAFVSEHGGKSIAIGRFVPGVKAVVPGIVGMLGMSQLYFVTVNVTSGIFWAATHVFPGMLLGQGLALAGELSDRLLVVLVALLVVLGIAGWLIRLAAMWFAPYLNHVRWRISHAARDSKNRSLNRFGRAIAPGNPRSVLVLVFALVAVTGLLMLIDLFTGLVLRNAVSNLDVSVASVMAELRNAPADAIMVRLTMLADTKVVWSLGLAIIIWLFAWRAWRAGLLAFALLLAGELLRLALAAFIRPEVDIGGVTVLNATFPSHHTLMAGLVFGILSVLASHAMRRWSKALVAAASGTLVVAIAFSRVYLGADWLSGVLGGFLIAAILSAVFGVVIEAIPSRRIRPLGLVGFATVVFLASGMVHMASEFRESFDHYAPNTRTATFDETGWAAGAWKNIPQRRIDLAGQPEEDFFAQWVGSADKLQSVMEAKGWISKGRWEWRDAFFYLDPEAPLSSLPPRPLLHRGFKARLTLVREIPGDPQRRDVIRAFRTHADVREEGVRQPVFVLSLTRDVNKPRFHLFTVPRTEVASSEVNAALLKELETTPGIRIIANGINPQIPFAVLRPAP